MALEMEPGPLRLFLDEEFPVFLYHPVFVPLAAQEVEAFETSDAHLGVQLATMAGRDDPTAHDGIGLLLGPAADAHASQTTNTDSSIAGVAASVDALEHELAGLTGEAVAGIEAGNPSAPDLDGLDRRYGEDTGRTAVPRRPSPAPSPQIVGNPVPPGPELSPPAPGDDPRRGHAERRLQEAAAAREQHYEAWWLEHVMAQAFARPEREIDEFINEAIRDFMGG